MKTLYDESEGIRMILDKAKHVVILQADNPDGDSLASALAFEQILGSAGKTVSLYCGVEIPGYLRYIAGWDRVSNELPSNFDASIIVDTSSFSLFENLRKRHDTKALAKRPCIIIDHHAVEPDVPFADIICSKPAVATGEVIYELSKQLDWKLDLTSRELLAMSIMTDSLGLTSEGTSARSIEIISELVREGVSLAKLEYSRRSLMRKSPELIAYKGRLLQRLEFFSDNRIVTVTIPWDEIEKYSPSYNPSMLVIDDMRMAENARLAIAFKVYRDGKITAKIRSNFGSGVAAELAKSFGGGGHAYASGFKVTDGRSLDSIKQECVRRADELLAELEETTDETL
jgi:bifunctional oligoribonuclease and PAP phosphatase NrnA